ncbi:N-6 DNA methylase [Stenotrophomonas sp. GZD-301]|uniref:N-6 DNA methylase n=1 Tax=Stenotrophomonas sp. GZD-301 TaxID=3404814 RepID=UPI003BB53D4C
MLDSDTKRRIDSCRDILVGKVPDPKSQVEQITIALIYKFMDDMDAQSEEFGGNRSFFVNGFEKYSWSKLLAPSMGGQATLNLYSEAISKMTLNTHLPALFRDIFKNAYLPYRDPETLKSFLKEIDGFSYDHSERLGDAFEYLLSVLGSQGDAGQFRTPRHIIDFIVRVINPQKHERILDPACGTAGFLISAWKYILEKNKKLKPGDTLTPTERRKLAANIRGYDISPDMVRLSLVNLYLHGFTDPHVDEYDTLTSEEKWNETADVILANPPFMSPKGGIKPHKRFSIQATRSEVLFVDFIHEHLSANGRAGIIVPDGVVFQSGAAYKAIRRLLVQSSLVAVVSLPAGVFQPYSGVKTSILILDKRLSKRTDKVLFVKVANDGFALGAQRRPIEKNDLPQAEVALSSFFSDPTQLEGHNVAELVERQHIAENGDWSLSSDRYVKQDSAMSRYQQVELGAAISTVTPPVKLQKSKYLEKGRYPIIDQSQNDIAGWTDETNALIHPDKPFVIFGDHTCAVKLIEQPFAQGADGIKIIRTADDLLPEFLFHYLKTYPLETDGYKRHFTDLKRRTIPLPPIETQRAIVGEISGYQSIIDGARMVLASYTPRIHRDADWPLRRISEIAEVNPKKSQLTISDESMLVSFVPMADLRENEMFFEPKEERAIGEVLKQYTYFQDDDVLIAKVTPCFENGKAGIAKRLVGGVGFGSSEFYVVRADKRQVLPEWVYMHLATSSFRAHGANRMTGTGGLQRVPRDVLSEWLIPVPPTINEQQLIIDEILVEEALISVNKKVVTRFEAKIKAVIDRVWMN